MSDLLSRAIRYATDLHQCQTDKLGAPYILHPLRVMGSLAEQGYGDDVLAAAVLHDVIEDTPATPGDLFERFGGTITIAVNFMTRKPNETYRDFVARAVTDPIGAIVKRADILDHVRPTSTTTDEIQGMIRKRYLPTLERVWGLSAKDVYPRLAPVEKIAEFVETGMGPGAPTGSGDYEEWTMMEIANEIRDRFAPKREVPRV